MPGTGVLMFRTITPFFPLLRRCFLGDLSDRLILPIQLLRKARIIELPRPLWIVNPSPMVLGIRILGFEFCYPFDPEESSIITSVGRRDSAKPGT